MIIYVVSFQSCPVLETLHETLYKHASEHLEPARPLNTSQKHVFVYGTRLTGNGPCHGVWVVDTFSPLARALGHMNYNKWACRFRPIFMGVSMIPNTRYVSCEWILQAALAGGIFGLEACPADTVQWNIQQELCKRSQYYSLKLVAFRNLKLRAVWILAKMPDLHVKCARVLVSTTYSRNKSRASHFLQTFIGKLSR